MNRTVPIIALVFVLSSCASVLSSRSVVGGIAESSPDEAYGPEYKYTYGTKEAVTRTNLEPAPTSYVLFPSLKYEINSEADFQTFQANKKDQTKRIYSYCRAHYDQFGSYPGVYEADRFANIVTFYWPLVSSPSREAEALAAIAMDVEDRCRYLTDNYDFGRADALLKTLEKGIYKDAVGPVMVLDFGFDAIVAPMDNVTTENINRIPVLWKQGIDEGIAKAQRDRKVLIDELEEVQTEKQTLIKLQQERKGWGNPYKKQIDELVDKEDNLNRQLFEKNSWGRALACAVGRPLLNRASDFMPSIKLLNTKIDQWCAPPEKMDK